MRRIERKFEVAVPVHAAYEPWARFEELPRFMEGIKAVRQLPDGRLRWRASLPGLDKQWDTVITEQAASQAIAWRSISGARNAGAVRFAPIEPRRTRVSLTLEYEPETPMERIGDALGLVSDAVDRTIEAYAALVEK